jgi:hypothetical protein
MLEPHWIQIINLVFGNIDNISEVTFKNKFAVTRMRTWTLLRMRRRTGGWWRTTRKARKTML